MANNIYVFPPSEADSESGRTVFFFPKAFVPSLAGFLIYKSLEVYLKAHSPWSS